MTETAAALVRHQLVSLTSYLQELRSFVEVDSTTYLTRPELRRASERMIQVAVECAIDTAETIVEAAGRPPPATARAAFEEIRSMGLIDEDLGALFARRYVGLRNRIVHDYERLDNARVQENGRALLGDGARLVGAVSAWVDAQPTR